MPSMIRRSCSLLAIIPWTCLINVKNIVHAPRHIAFTTHINSKLGQWFMETCLIPLVMYQLPMVYVYIVIIGFVLLSCMICQVISSAISLLLPRLEDVIHSDNCYLSYFTNSVIKFILNLYLISLSDLIN